MVAEQTRFKVKYLHFDQKKHRRPPYYGTWRKKSKVINPRKPFAKDAVHKYLIKNIGQKHFLFFVFF